MICVQETVSIWFKAGISNTIKSPEAHFAAPAEDVTRQEDFTKVQTLAAFFHSFHTVVQRTKYSCFLAISPDFLPTS
jgi:N12 class adenine-specific DNA methylase